MTTHGTPVTGDHENLREALKALANPVRFQVLQWLRDPDGNFPVESAGVDRRAVGVCVSHIQARTGLAQSTVSAYMALLENAGLVRSTRVGKWTHYRRDEERIAQVAEEFRLALGGTPPGDLPGDLPGRESGTAHRAEPAPGPGLPPGAARTGAGAPAAVR